MTDPAFILAALGIEDMAFGLLDKCSTTKLCPHPKDRACQEGIHFFNNENQTHGIPSKHLVSELL